jgi:amino acid permease
LKGYTGVGVLLCPKAFQNGGYAFSPLMTILSGVLSTICVLKLIEVGNDRKIYSYSGLVETFLGKKTRYCVDFMIALMQWNFTLISFVFCLSSMKTITDQLFNLDSPTWPYMVILLLIHTPIAFVR